MATLLHVRRFLLDNFLSIYSRLLPSLFRVCISLSCLQCISSSSFPSILSPHTSRRSMSFTANHASTTWSFTSILLLSRLHINDLSRTLGSPSQHIHSPPQNQPILLLCICFLLSVSGLPPHPPCSQTPSPPSLPTRFIWTISLFILCGLIPLCFAILVQCLRYCIVTSGSCVSPTIEGLPMMTSQRNTIITQQQTSYMGGWSGLR